MRGGKPGGELCSRLGEIGGHARAGVGGGGALHRLLVEQGYSGAISSEYEGWHWNNWQSPFEIIAAEQAVQRSAAEASGSRMITDAAEARRILDTHLGKAVQA